MGRGLSGGTGAGKGAGGDGGDGGGAGRGLEEEAAEDWRGQEEEGGTRRKGVRVILGINHERRSSCTFCLEAVSASVTK